MRIGQIGGTVQSLLAFTLALLFPPPLVTGCAHHPRARVDHANFYAPNLERALKYWTANHSIQPANHFFVYATELDRGELVSALVYWREGGRILDYSEEPQGAEPRAWRLRPKIDRNAVRSDEQLSAGNDVVPHEVWQVRARWP